MKLAAPPRLPTWLLNQVAPNEALAGDLIEQFRQGRSSLWYWRQVIVAMVISVYDGIRYHKGAAGRAVLMGLALMWLFGFVTGPLDDVTGRWAVGFSNWLLVNELHDLRFWWHRLELYNLTPSVIWCVGLWSIGWLVVRTHPFRNVALIFPLWVALLIYNAQATFGLAFYWIIVAKLSTAWLYGVFFRSLFYFVIVPISLFAGGFAAADRHKPPLVA
jgi:hypothetical protein